MLLTPVDQDDEHLRLLSLFHYIVGGLAMFFGCFPLIYMSMGVALAVSPQTFNNGLPTDGLHALFGWLLFLVGAFSFLFCESIGVCTVVSGRRLAQRRGYTFNFVAACVSCVMFPLGTALGICTILVLSRPSVKALFGRRAAPLPTRAG